MKFYKFKPHKNLLTAFSTPIDNDSIDPLFDAYRDVRILLTTRQNINNPQVLQFRNLDSVRGSHYNPARPTRVLIHGFWEDDTSDIKVETSAELLRYYDFNVLFIDWSEGSRTINYIAAAGRVPTVGQFTASYLDFLHENSLLNFQRLSVVGFSLGAHIAGMVGKNTRRGRVQYILGLDPAGPLFSVRNPESRIDANDGVYVECIHTNGPTLAIVGLGIGAAICDADYFPNGGQSQPGCLLNTCSHLRAVDLYGKLTKLKSKFLETMDIFLQLNQSPITVSTHWDAQSEMTLTLDDAFFILASGWAEKICSSIKVDVGPSSWKRIETLHSLVGPQDHNEDETILFLCTTNFYCC